MTDEITYPSSVLVQKILILDSIDDEVRSDLDGPVRATKMCEHKVHRMWIFPIGYFAAGVMCTYATVLAQIN
jgi:hypothetical protein